MEKTVRKRNSNVSNAVVIGTGPAALRFYQKLNNKKRQRYHIIGFIGDDNESLPAPRLCGYEELASYLLSADAEEVIIATESDQVYMMPDIISLCEDHGIRYSIYSAEHFPGPEPSYDGAKEKVRIRAAKRSKLNSTPCRFLKRTFDLLLSLLLILILWPLMLLIAIGVRFTGKGSVLIRERIIGRSRRPYVMLKFRSTEVEPEVAETEEEPDDATVEDTSSEEDLPEKSNEISPFRLWLRKTKLDLLPRLFNILTGKMSFVGPRPGTREFIRNNRDTVRGFMQLFRMRPGLIGWPRLISKRREEQLQEEEWIRYDLWYVANWSPHLDLSIIRKTLFAEKTYSEAAEDRKKVEAARSKAEEERKIAEEARKAVEVERKAAEEARKAAEEARKAVAEEERRAAEEARKAEEEARKAAQEEQKAAREVEKTAKKERGTTPTENEAIPETAPAAFASEEDVVSDRPRSRGEVMLALAGYFGRPMLIILAPLVLLYYLCYRVDLSVSAAMFLPLEIVSLLLFIVTTALAIKKRTAIQVILFINVLWMVFTRILHDDLTVTPHGVCYFAAMFFAFYSCGILLKNKQREYFMDVVALVVGGVLLLWGLVGFATALTGQSLPGFEMIRLLAEKTPALMTFISFYGTHRNISSTYFVIMMGIAIYQYVHHRTLFWKVMAFLFVPIGYIMVAMQHSRSNYMAASIVLTVALGSVVLDKLAEQGRRVHIVILMAAAVVCVFVFLLGFYKCNTFMEVLGIKFREVWAVIADLTGLPKFTYTVKFTDPRNLSLEITTLNRRTDIWRNAIPVLKSHPEILSIGRPENLIMETINERVLWRKEPHMHNALLQQLMLAGVPGALLYMSMFCIMCKNIFMAFRHLRKKNEAPNRVLCGILLALFAYGILEPLLSPKIPLASLMFCLVAGCLEGEQRKNKAK